jgi:hypothetical protein
MDRKLALKVQGDNETALSRIKISQPYLHRKRGRGEISIPHGLISALHPLSA